MSKDVGKTKLSRHLLDMKFMKKSKEKEQKDQEEEEHRCLYGGDTIDTIKKEGSRYIINESYASCLGLLPPRMSFMGRNPEIERLMQQNNGKETTSCKMPGIQDEEMAERYSTLVGTVAKKFEKRKQHTFSSPEPSRKRNRPKQFQKPSDDWADENVPGEKPLLHLSCGIGRRHQLFWCFITHGQYDISHCHLLIKQSSSGDSLTSGVVELLSSCQLASPAACCYRSLYVWTEITEFLQLEIFTRIWYRFKDFLWTGVPVTTQKPDCCFGAFCDQGVTRTGNQKHFGMHENWKVKAS